MLLNLFSNSLPMNLQYFAEDTGGSGGAGNSESTETTNLDDQQPTDPSDTKPDGKPGDNQSTNPDDDKPKTFTQAEVEKMIAERTERERSKSYKKGIEAGKTEAEKLAKMGDDEKQQYKFEQMQNELENMKQEKARSEMVTTANYRLQEAHISLPSKSVERFVVGQDAEDTNTRLNDFISLYNDMKASVKNDLLRNGRVPKDKVNSANGTSEDVGARIAKQNHAKVKNPYFKQPNA
ncbi:hypothetical protein IWT25_00755 [Secundilactobacillus pentosiphilus]|uniref:DUF4355 domain-containing protein n=1 Tax=Secundilactobacillus pentosiphilus TaxID=1714682 RepID=A0A1Z5IUS6_9LACO|nr:DUF4355 domain-containing protein [Secundilactobacillus pentosiphilus]GAX05449.1 hypothetical protein IWT25_00755 [Secundilactobacillus pentosiphilus]